MASFFFIFNLRRLGGKVGVEGISRGEGRSGCERLNGMTKWTKTVDLECFFSSLLSLGSRGYQEVRRRSEGVKMDCRARMSEA